MSTDKEELDMLGMKDSLLGVQELIEALEPNCDRPGYNLTPVVRDLRRIEVLIKEERALAKRIEPERDMYKEQCEFAELSY